MTNEDLITRIGQLAYGTDSFKQHMAEDLGISRNYLDKIIAGDELPKSVRLQLAGFVDRKIVELDDRQKALDDELRALRAKGQ